MSTDDLAAVREALHDARPLAYQDLRLKRLEADAALDRLAARLEKAEAREAALREALDEVLGLIGESKYRPLDYDSDREAFARARAALAANPD